MAETLHEDDFTTIFNTVLELVCDFLLLIVGNNPQYYNTPYGKGS
jgi:hypothetical protein